MLRPRPARPALAVALLASVLASCGVPTDDAPRPIARDRVPFGLLDREDPPPASTTPVFSEAVTVYFVSGERLSGAGRRAPAPLTPGRALDALLAGPTATEAALGLRSAIGTAGVTATGIEGPLVGVELGRSFALTGAAEQVLAIAQIVYTLTALPGVEGVTFTVAGRPVEVPRADGTLAAGPVARSDFADLAPA